MQSLYTRVPRSMLSHSQNIAHSTGDRQKKKSGVQHILSYVRWTCCDFISYNTRKSTCLIRTRYGRRVYIEYVTSEKKADSWRLFFQSNLSKQIISSIMNTRACFESWKIEVRFIIFLSLDIQFFKRTNIIIFFLDKRTILPIKRLENPSSHWQVPSFDVYLSTYN